MAESVICNLLINDRREAPIIRNEIFIGKGDLKEAVKRLALQHTAMTTIKLIAYIAEMAMTQNCILPKQFEKIATTTCLTPKI